MLRIGILSINSCKGERGMTTQQIGYFLKLAEELNYTNVAQIFFITQPTLSKQIVNLENELKVTLFHRSHGGVHLTPAGKKFYDRIKPIFLELMEAVRETQSYEDEREHLVIGIQEEQLVSNRFMLAINLLRHDYPDLKITIHRAATEELMEGLELGRFDLVNMMVYPTMPYEEKYEYMELDNECSYLAYSQKILDLPEEITIQELSDVLENQTLLFPYVFGAVDDSQAKRMFLKTISGLDERKLNIQVEQTGRPISLPIQVSSGLGVSVSNATNLFSIDHEVRLSKIIGTENSYSKGLLFNKQPSSPYIKVIINKIKAM